MTSHPPLLLALDIGDLLYVVLPLLWVVGQFFTNKNEDEKSKPNEAEMAERRRRIQEEIRRRIEAQRSGRGNTTGESSSRTTEIPRSSTDEPGRMSPQTSSPAPTRPRYDPMRSETEQRRPSTPREPMPETVAPRRQPEPVVTSAEREPSIQERLAEQRKRLAEAEQVRREAMEKAASMGRRHTHEAPTAMTSSSTGGWNTDLPLGDQIRAALENPEAARSAIVLSEILGPPMALREQIGDRMI